MVGTRAKRLVSMALTVGLVATSMLSAPTAHATTGDIGHLDQSYTGATNPATSDKPQSKLWYNDGLWWATMFNSTSLTWHIYRLDRAAGTWVDTGTRVDDRPQTLSDALWSGSKLYIGSQYVTVSDDSTTRVSVAKPARLYRYSYNSTTKTYTLDTGFPSAINNSSSESLTIDKDTTGRIWATWTQVSGSSTSGYASKVYINSSGNGGSTWGSPMVLPAPNANTNIAPDDISAVVAYGKSKIGVMWSNHLDDTVYWDVHADGDSVTTWKGSVAVRGSKQPDDHLNLKTIEGDQQGRVFAAVKTSLDQLSGSPSTAPQIKLLQFKPGTAAWTTTTFGTLADCHTRPIVVLDDENQEVHVFATGPTASGCSYSGAPGTIYEKTAPIDNPVFASGRGTAVIRDAASANVNNVTSTKQSVNSASGLVVLASNNSTKRYWHSDKPVRHSSPVVPVASFTASPTSGTAPLTVKFTDTSTNSPTSWSWSFGNGTTSTAQNPSATYSTAGSYTVTLKATNSAGTSTTATKTITVTTASTGGIVRASTSTTAVTTAATGLTVSAPAGTSSGDVLVSCLASSGATVATAPSGWTRFAAATGVSNPKVYGYYKVAGSSEPSSYGWTFSSSVTSSGGIARYTGATGLDGTTSVAAGALASSGTVPGVTTATAGAMVMGCMGINSGSTSVLITGPTGMSAAWDLAGKRQEFDDALQPTAGATGSRTWQFSSGRDWAGWLAALR